MTTDKTDKTDETAKTDKTLRPELKLPLPRRMRDLPIHRGYPVPWFVAWVDGEPEFRAADGRKWMNAVSRGLCWVCGQQLGSYRAFVLGPMCGITRTTAEPACHRECAQWSIENCPFLARPHMVRREDNLPEKIQPPAGEMLARNPGVTALWIARDFEVFRDPKNRPLISVGDPLEVLWFQEGRPATRAEIDRSIAGGLPALEALAKLEGPKAEKALSKQIAEFGKLLPPEENR